MNNEGQLKPSTEPAVVDTAEVRHADPTNERHSAEQSQTRPDTQPDATTLAKVRADNEKALQDSREGVWYLKEIIYNGDKKKIVTQNYNGYAARYLRRARH